MGSFRKLLSRFIKISAPCLFLGSCASVNLNTVQIDDVYVTLGEPRHWTLDDAHYLLAGVHGRARNLSVTGPSDLNPNSFNSSRLEQIQTAVSASISLDQLAGAKNALEVEKLEQAVSDAQTARATENALVAQRDDLRQQSLDLEIRQATLQATADAAQAEVKRLQSIKTSLLAQKDALPDSADSSAIDGRINDVNDDIIDATLTADKATAAVTEVASQNAATKAQINFLDKDITEAQSKQSLESPSLTSVQPPQLQSPGVNNEYTNAILEAIKSDPAFSGAGITPSFNVSDQIANYIQAENELLARQLTLLRDEIGPNRTIVFLELPHNIDSAPSVSNARRIAIEWSIESYCTNDPIEAMEDVIDTVLSEGVTGLSKTTLNLLQNDESNEFALLMQATENKMSGVSAVGSDSPLARLRRLDAQNKRNEKNETRRDELKPNTVRSNLKFALENEIRDDFLKPNSFIDAACYDSKGNSTATITDGSADDRAKPTVKWQPYAWDLIPSADAYNIANFDVRGSEFNFAFIISRLSGIGAQGRYSRRRDIFQQFATQEVFASAFGQGENRFGWILNPKPGANRVSGGAKTTFAALIVPKGTSVVNLKSRYCVMGRKSVLSRKPEAIHDPSIQTGKQCRDVNSAGSEKSKRFSIALQKNKRFWVDRIDFGHARAGDPASIVIRGDGFSPFQTSILVNGHPLQNYTGVQGASRAFATEKDKKASGPEGFFEVTNSSTIAINLRMPSDFIGTPDITIVTPGRSRTINRFPTKVNGRLTSLQRNIRTPMFQNSLSISGRPVVRKDSANGIYYIDIRGQGFSEAMRVDVYPTKGVTDASKLKDLRKKIYSDAFATIDFALATKDWAKLKSVAIRLHKRQQDRADHVSFDVAIPAEPKKPNKRVAVSGVKILSAKKKPNGSYDLRLGVSGENIPNGGTIEDLTRGITVAKSAITYVSERELYFNLTTDEDKALLLFRNANPAPKNKPTYKITYEITVPKMPSITSVENSKFKNKACGVEGGGDRVLIVGENLHLVDEVFFGAMPVRTTPSGDPTKLTIVTPPGKGDVLVTVKSSSVGAVQPQGVAYKYSDTGCDRPLFRWSN